MIVLEGLIVEGLTEEVQELVNSGRLHLFDGEWICRIPAERQMASAMKCISGAPLEMMQDRAWPKLSHHAQRPVARSSSNGRPL